MISGTDGTDGISGTNEKQRKVFTKSIIALLIGIETFEDKTLKPRRMTIEREVPLDACRSQWLTEAIVNHITNASY